MWRLLEAGHMWSWVLHRHATITHHHFLPLLQLHQPHEAVHSFGSCAGACSTCLLDYVAADGPCKPSCSGLWCLLQTGLQRLQGLVKCCCVAIRGCFGKEASCEGV